MSDTHLTAIETFAVVRILLDEKTSECAQRARKILESVTGRLVGSKQFKQYAVLIGEAYFLEEDYKSALKWLEYGDPNSPLLADVYRALRDPHHALADVNRTLGIFNQILGDYGKSLKD